MDVTTTERGRDDSSRDKEKKPALTFTQMAMAPISAEALATISPVALGNLGVSSGKEFKQRKDGTLISGLATVFRKTCC